MIACRYSQAAQYIIHFYNWRFLAVNKSFPAGCVIDFAEYLKLVAVGGKAVLNNIVVVFHQLNGGSGIPLWCKGNGRLESLLNNGRIRRGEAVQCSHFSLRIRHKLYSFYQPAGAQCRRILLHHFLPRLRIGLQDVFGVEHIQHGKVYISRQLTFYEVLINLQFGRMITPSELWK